jgi:4-hydroxybenzoate polyprenyltransferase
MTFFPYTLMNASYTIIGSFLAPAVNPYKAGLLALVYLLAVGISAHALDATGPNKPWGDFLSRNQLRALAIGALIPALFLGLYLALTYAVLLLLVGLVELFFLFGYNLELFDGVFHSDGWFAFSWGFLPVIAGYVLQSDSIGPSGLAGGLFGFLTAYIEIKASRPYKEIKRSMRVDNTAYAETFESILKAIVSTVIVVALALVLLRVLL